MSAPDGNRFFRDGEEITSLVVCDEIYRFEEHAPIRSHPSSRRHEWRFKRPPYDATLLVHLPQQSWLSSAALLSRDGAGRGLQPTHLRHLNTHAGWKDPPRPFLPSSPACVGVIVANRWAS